MIDIFVYDWKEGVNELFNDLLDKRQGKISYFYNYDTKSDEFLFVVSDKELTVDEIQEAVDKHHEE